MSFHKGVVAGIMTLFAAGMLGSGVVLKTARPPDPPVDPPPVHTPVPVVEPRGFKGDAFPAIYDKWWLHSYDRVAYLTALQETEKFRTNFMVVWEGQLKYEVEAVSSDGVALGTLGFDTYMLEPCTPDNVTYKDGVCSGMYQLNRVITQISPNYQGGYSLKITPLGGTGKGFFYATTIDNKSQDYTLYTQFRVTRSNNIWSQSGLYYQGSYDAETEKP